jgi:hypothetical protein
MSASDDRLGDPLGLGHSWPRPGWVVLDAVRDSGLTGEVRFDTDPGSRVYAERGRIYFAEKMGHPWVGARLVDAGALTAAELERGTVRVDDVDHLGRLFERAPSIDRHELMVRFEFMVDEVLAWIATQMVAGVVTMPYVRHPTGIHRWYAPTVPGSAGQLAAGRPLPAPDPRDEPVSERTARAGDLADRPTGSFAVGGLEGDIEADIGADVGADDFGIDLRIEWADISQPLDPPVFGRAPAPDAPPVPDAAAPAWPSAPPAAAPTSGAGSEPSAASASGSASVAAVEPVPADIPHTRDERHERRVRDDDEGAESERALAAFASSVDLLGRFEVVWPSGEVDDPFPPPTPILDRDNVPDEEQRSEADDVILAVRRAIAAIEMTFAADSGTGRSGGASAPLASPPVGLPSIPAPGESSAASSPLGADTADEATRFVGSGGWLDHDPWERFGARESSEAPWVDTDTGTEPMVPPAFGTAAPASSEPGFDPSAPSAPPRVGVSEGRRSALRRLIDGIRNR